MFNMKTLKKWFLNEAIFDAFLERLGTLISVSTSYTTYMVGHVLAL